MFDGPFTLVMKSAHTIPPLLEVVKNKCTMERSAQCSVSYILEGDHIDWVDCDRCKSWYHCTCIGLDVQTGDKFVCCVQVEPKNAHT